MTKLPRLAGASLFSRRSALTLSALVVLLGLLCISLHTHGLPPFPAALTTTTSFSAGVLVLAGLGLFAAAREDGSSRWHFFPRLAGIGVLVLATGALVMGASAILFCIAFFLVGAAFLCLDMVSERRPHIAEWLACFIGWLGGLTLTGSVLTVSAEYRAAKILPAAPYTSLGLIALAVGFLFARPERGIAAIATSATSGGTLLRRLVPVTLLVPPFGMWALVVLAPRLGLFHAKFGGALATLIAGSVVAAIEVKLAERLASFDSERQDKQASLRRTLDHLAQVLRERDRVQKDLARSNRDLDEFAYAASHDLRAPLRGIANLAHWIEEDLGATVSAGTRQQLEMLRGRVQRMEALIDGILKYSRAGRSFEPSTRVNVADLIVETIELVAPPANAHIDIKEMPVLQTERAPLQQIFLNLISNAIKHAHRDDPRVEISAEDQNEWVRFVVADNGPGVPEQYQDRIWGMFQTLESRDQVEGTGIGLATVKKLVERRGGQVGLESKEGQGARFFFLWPQHHVP